MIYEQTNDQITDFSDLGRGWTQFGNITVSFDGSRAIFERASGSSAAYSYPFPASNGAGFIETTINGDDFQVALDFATDGAHSSGTTEWVGLSFRNGATVLWLFPDHSTNTLKAALDSGSGPTIENVMTLPTSASRRYLMHAHYDSTSGQIECRVLPFESVGSDLGGYFDAAFTTTAFAIVPTHVGISMCAPSGVGDPELYVYSLRLAEPSQPARHWYALADVSANRPSVETMLRRKSRASAAAHWSRDDYFVAGSSKSLLGSTPIISLEASYSTNELERYLLALENISGLEITNAWFGVPRCAVTGEMLYTELGPTVETTMNLTGVFGTKVFSFTATNNHSWTAFDKATAEIPDDESWIVMILASPTIAPAANVPLLGKQDLFQIAPVPRNGYQVWMNTGDVMFDLSDTAGGIQTITAAKVYTPGQFFGVVAGINRSTGLAQIAHDTASSATANVAGLSYAVPNIPLRVGDSRINRAETAPEALIHLVAIAQGTQVESVNYQTLAADLLAAAT